MKFFIKKIPNPYLLYQWAVYLDLECGQGSMQALVTEYKHAKWTLKDLRDGRRTIMDKEEVKKNLSLNAGNGVYFDYILVPV